MEQVLLEKLTDLQVLRKFPAFYGTRKFITALTRASHLSLSLARSFEAMPSSHLVKIYFNSFLSSTPGYCRWSPSSFPTEIMYALFPMLVTCPTHFIFFDLITRILFGEEYRS